MTALRLKIWITDFQQQLASPSALSHTTSGVSWRRIHVFNTPPSQEVEAASEQD